MTGKMTKIGLVWAVSLTLLVTSLAVGLSSADQVTSGNTITPTVAQGTTDRLGGGDWVVVHAGNTNFGVVYGTASNPNKIYIFADYKRYLAGVDFYDSQGNYLRTKGVSVEAVFAQSLDRLIEFRDVDGNHRFDLGMWDGLRNTSDIPVKGLNLTRAWTLSDFSNETQNGVLNVTFTLSVSDVPYTWVWRALPRPGPIQAPPSTGSVSEIAFTFHISVGVENATARVPWFKVTITGGNENRVTNRTFDGWREFSGQRVNMSVKYDQEIDGWDFAHQNSELLLETRMMFGYIVPRELLDRYRLNQGERALNGDQRNGTLIGDDRNQMPTEPRPIQPSGDKGTITFADDWDRVGRFTWVSDVNVDGGQEQMYFQVHGGGPLAFPFGRNAAVAGLGVLGAFVYPQGDSIVHDPAFDAASYEFGIPSVTNLSPVGVLFLQMILIVAAVVLVGALKLRRKGQQ